jgi:hypothetical protein
MIEALVASAVALVAPYLEKASEEAAKTVGKESAASGLKLLGWLRDKATGRAKEALEDAEAKPTEDNKADLRSKLRSCWRPTTDLLTELRALLPASATETAGQQMTLGDNGRAVQNKGDNNRINISG